jgi:hypothetical protein
MHALCDANQRTMFDCINKFHTISTRHCDRICSGTDTSCFVSNLSLLNESCHPYIIIAHIFTSESVTFHSEPNKHLNNTRSTVEKTQFTTYHSGNWYFPSTKRSTFFSDTMTISSDLDTRLMTSWVRF